MSTEFSLEQPNVDATLQSLRYYYQNLVASHEYIADQARQQLDHVEALLGGKAPKATTSKVARTDVEAVKSIPAVPTIEKAEPIAAPAKGKPKGPRGEGRRGKGGKSEDSVSLKLQKAYQGKTMLGAIEQVLQTQKGEAINTDDVVVALYGKLKPDSYKVAKDRVTKSLSKGKLEGKWERVPDRLGYYRLSGDR